MADEIRKYPNLAPGDLDVTFKDMGDGTFAPVIAAEVVITEPTPDTATVTAVPDSATDVQLLAANSARRGFVIFNASTKTLFIRFGVGAASLTDYTWRIDSHLGEWFPPGLWTGEIRAIWQANTATGQAFVTEIT